MDVRSRHRTASSKYDDMASSLRFDQTCILGTRAPNGDKKHDALDRKVDLFSCTLRGRIRMRDAGWKGATATPVMQLKL